LVNEICKTRLVELTKDDATAHDPLTVYATERSKDFHPPKITVDRSCTQQLKQNKSNTKAKGNVFGFVDDTMTENTHFVGNNKQYKLDHLESPVCDGPSRDTERGSDKMPAIFFPACGLPNATK